MNRVRRGRLAAAVFLLAGSAATVALVLVALNENINAFHPPERIVNGTAPVGTTIRAGGMVVPGSVSQGRGGPRRVVRAVGFPGVGFPRPFRGHPS